MYYKHLLNLIIQLKLLTFSLYVHCYWGKCSKCPLHVSQLVFKMEGYFHQKIKVVLMDVIGSKCVWKSRCDWWTSQCGIVGILLDFHMWTGMKNFRSESGVKFFIHEIFHTWNRCEFSIRHVQPCSTCEILNLHTFQTCFWCESGMKQAWSYENILYGNTVWTKHLDRDKQKTSEEAISNIRAFMAGSASQAGDVDSSRAPGLTSGLQGPWMSTVVLYFWCHCDSASVLLYFTFLSHFFPLPC